MEKPETRQLNQEHNNDPSIAMRLFQLMEHFERWIMLLVNVILMVVITVALWRFAENTYQLLMQQGRGNTRYIDFQATFGMLLTLLIAVEFGKSIKAALEGRGLVVQAKIIVLIGIIASARKFLVFDAKAQDVNVILAYGAIALVLGVVYWLLGILKDSSTDVI